MASLGVNGSSEECGKYLEHKDREPEEQLGPKSRKNGRQGQGVDEEGTTTQPEHGNGYRDNIIRKDEVAKGKLLTTPSRLFKLLIPLEINNRKTVETIAILIHTQQPLSYLERLIQHEIDPIETPDGQRRRPGVSFIAPQLDDNSVLPRRRRREEVHELAKKGKEEEKIPGIESGSSSRASHPESRQGGKQCDSHSYPHRTDSNPDSNPKQQLVRWSQNTEIGDFIRDAARAGEFIIAIEGMPTGLGQIRVAVPSFEERTYFLRMRLRKISGRIHDIAEIKHECDALAHRGAQRVAIGGFGVLASWWYIVYRLTFETDLGWDTMEPVTYLASLSTLMGGYLWFLYHNREISYRSALDFTISTRQKKLYQVKGVDLQLWESLIDEGNLLRREIKNIAADYEAEWDERQDERDEKVTEALKKKEREQNKEDDEKRLRDRESGGS